MVNVYSLAGKDVEGREYQPVVFAGGLDQETSRFVVPPGTLSDCLNYNASTKGYTRAQGLWYYDGTLDEAVHNMWFVGGDDDESSLVGPGFSLGGSITWGTASSGRVVYYERGAATPPDPDYTMLGILDISGAVPTDGDVISESETSTTWTLTGPMTYPAATLATAQNPDTGAYIADTVTKYLTFLNDTVNHRLVSQTGVVAAIAPSTFATYHGQVPGIGPISGGWQFEDKVYVTRDSYGVSFSYGTIELIPGDDVLVELDPIGTERVSIAGVELTSGSWSAGDAAGWVVFKPSASTTDFTALAAPKTALGHITDLTATNMATMLTTTPPRKGLVWRGTVHGWEWVDTGWTINYNTGTNSPNVRAAPLFTEDLVAAQRATGSLPVGVGSSVGVAPYIDWVTPNNILADDAANATCALTAVTTSYALKATIPANTLPQDDLAILGVTVTLEAHFTGATAPIDSSIRLVNAATGATFYRSANRARREDLILATPTVITYGSASDTWGIEDISAADINNGDVSIWIQYSNTGVGTVLVDYVSFDITYVPNTEKVWFNDGATDVANGVIHAFQTESGTFADPDNDAVGTMSLMSIGDPGAIGVGMEMWSEVGAGVPSGILIAKVDSAPVYNVVPGWAELLAVDSRCQTILQNYYDNDDAEAIYGVTGATAAFTYDGESFAYLQTPLQRSVDKPRHVAFHDNRLALGFQPGTVVLSAVGTPNDFSAVNGASAWGVGDRITGLLSLPGSVLGVFSYASIRSLEGSNAEEGAMRTIAPTSGCREYTMQNIVGPYFADNRGISNIETSQNYGDFDLLRASDPVRTWLKDRLQDAASVRTVETRPVASVAIRNKNQYRLYFADGWVLVLYFGPEGKIAPTFMHYDTAAYSDHYVPTFINSTVLSNGKERIVMGTEVGDVWIVDGSEVIQDPAGAIKPDCYIVTNPVNFGEPDRNQKHYHTVIQGQFAAAQTVQAWADTNYVFEETGAAQTTVTFGSYSNTPIFTSKNEIDSAYLPILADGYSLKLQTTMDGSIPHSFQSLLYRESPKGMDRNRVSKTY